MMEKKCSFCGNSYPSKPPRLIKGAQPVYICFSCVARCDEVFKDDEEGGAPGAKPRSAHLLRPKEIKDYLDAHIIAQDTAKKALAVAVYNHYKRLNNVSEVARSPLNEPLSEPVSDEQAQGALEELEGLKDQAPQTSQEEHALTSARRRAEARAETRAEALSSPVRLSKGNILMVGPTGVGKTALAERIAELLDVPFVVKDATTLTAAGYVGEDVESVIKALWEAADRDVERAARGIVVIDEVDKIARRGASASAGRDVGGEGVQQALLKLIESSHVNIQPDGGRSPRAEPIQVDTTHILFIFCGAFVGLDKLIQQRMAPGSIGFGAPGRAQESAQALPRLSGKNLPYNDVIKHLQSDDLLKFGIIPEFMGRMPILVHLEELSEEAMVEVLWRPKSSLVRQYERLLSLNQIALELTDGAKRAVVRKAVGRKSGARGLRSVMESLMLDVMYDLPDRPDIGKVIIDEEFVEGKRAEPLLLTREVSA